MTRKKKKQRRGREFNEKKEEKRVLSGEEQIACEDCTLCITRQKSVSWDLLFGGIFPMKIGVHVLENGSRGY